jgi:NAD(P)-dependent dehydrogenase (short-subunit alcohol dehydrogenase family)
MTTDPSRVWFITGASRGFGRSFAQAALARGERVVATARRPEQLAELVEQGGENALAVQLDVTDRAQVERAVHRAVERFGRLDVVVNNAGYGLSGALEETTEEEARAQFETNFFGALWVTQAALPVLRDQGGGWIVQVSSVGGVAGFPGVSIYNASKWALEGMTEAVAQEVEGFGIRLMSVEPSAFRTDWAGDSMSRTTPMPEYDEVLAARRKALSGAEDAQAATAPGDPDRAAQALLEALDSPTPPKRLLLGNNAFETATQRYRDRLAEAEAWEGTARGADFPKAEVG